MPWNRGWIFSDVLTYHMRPIKHRGELMPGKSGWLVFKRDDTSQRVSMLFGCAADQDKAIRFGRRQDAKKIIAFLRKTTDADSLQGGWYMCQIGWRRGYDYVEHKED